MRVMDAPEGTGMAAAAAAAATTDAAANATPPKQQQQEQLEQRYGTTGYSHAGVFSRATYVFMAPLLRLAAEKKVLRAMLKPTTSFPHHSRHPTHHDQTPSPTPMCRSTRAAPRATCRWTTPPPMS